MKSHPALSQREHVVHDQLEPCPYLPAETARMPLRWQTRRLTGPEFDESLARGDRRVGRMLYRTECPSCHACEPLRIPVDGFRPSKSQRRVLKQNRDVKVELAPATFSEEKLELYNRHKTERGLARKDAPMTEEGYRGWFLASCCRTVEMRYLLDGKLVGLGILDAGEKALSSVYFFFDPSEAARSLGTFSVLVELGWWRAQGGHHHYLGLYVADCRQLVYKARFFPHERLVGGQWTGFADPAS